MGSIWELVQSGLGVDRIHGPLEFQHMALRALVVYVAGIAMLRLGSRRLLGRRTPFDFVLTIILGSTMARAINGAAPLFPTLVAALLLVVLDRAFASAAWRWEGLGPWLHGSVATLVVDGKRDEEGLRRTHVTDQALDTAIRLAGVRRLEDVLEARLEPSGEISVVTRS
jgi:uncharacterized membrane protein YcaP (DUF421 family)